MRKYLMSLAMVVMFVLVQVTAIPTPATAVNLFGGVDCSNPKVAESAVCQDAQKNTNNPLTGKNGVILRVSRILAIIAGLAAVIIIIVSGLRYVMAGSDSNQAASARTAIIYSLIGIVVILVAQSLVALILGNL